MVYPRIHPSTSRMVSSLKAAGFKRSEFSVVTPKDRNGEYGSTIVTLYNTNRSIELVPSILEQGLGVYIVMLDNHIAHVSVEVNPRIAIRNLDDHTLVEIKDGKMSYFSFKDFYGEG